MDGTPGLLEAFVEILMLSASAAFVLLAISWLVHKMRN